MRSRSVSVAILTFTLFGPNPGSLIAQAPISTSLTSPYIFHATIPGFNGSNRSRTEGR